MKLMKVLGILIVLVLLSSFVSAGIVKTVTVTAKPTVNVVKVSNLVKPVLVEEKEDVVKPLLIRSIKPAKEKPVLELVTGGMIFVPFDYLDVVDKAPEFDSVGVDPASPAAGSDFTITVSASDDNGIDTIRLKKGALLLDTEDCSDALTCTAVFTVSEAVADDYTYKVFVDDTDVNHAVKYIEITVQDCVDTDSDGVCDIDEPGCVGENLSNMPADTDCTTYTFVDGCHEESYESSGHVVLTIDCDYLDDVCVDYADVADVCDGVGSIIYGTCTNFTNDSGSTVCDTDVGDVYSCIDGTALGMDVYSSMTRQYCGVDTGSCDGTIETYGGWGVYDDCSLTEVCVEGDDACVVGVDAFEVNLTYDVTSGPVPLMVNFTCSWGGGVPPYGYSFDFAGQGVLYDINFDPLNLVYEYNETGVYEVTCNVSDNNGSNVVKGVTINVTEATGLPNITSLVVTPDPVYTNDVLTCTPSGWYSSVGDPEAYYYQWFDGGVVLSGETSDTFDCSTVGCDKGNNISCKVMPYDSVGNGAIWEDSVIISNTLPLVNVSLSPDPIYFDENMLCICDVTDIDGDSASCNYYEFWFQLINGSWFRLYNGSSNVLPWTVVFKDNHYKCFVRATDGEDTAGMIESPILTVSNYYPEMESVYWNGTESDYTDVTSPYNIFVYYNDEGLVTIATNDPETAIDPTYTCYNQDSYEISDCTFNFTAISDLAPSECDSHVESGCFGIVDDQGLFEIIVEMTDVDGNKANESVWVNVSLQYLPPVIFGETEYNITEGDWMTCPCPSMDPDGGVSTSECPAPLNETLWMAKYEDVGTINSHCNATDDEGQVSHKEFVINVVEATYNTSIRSWWSNDTSAYYRNETVNLFSLYDNHTQNEVTRGLINDIELMENIATGWPGAIVCTDNFCGNTNKMENITDYFANFQNNLTVSQQNDIYGSNWPDYMDNLGLGDSNEEIQGLRIWIQKV